MSRQFDQRSVRSMNPSPVHYKPGRVDRRADPYGLPAGFASQLLAARDRLGVRRFENKSPAGLASNAYLQGGRIAVKRMPNGYVRTLVV